MEDSGIDSEDVLSYQKDRHVIKKMTHESDDEFSSCDVEFRGVNNENFRNKSNRFNNNYCKNSNNGDSKKNLPSTCRILQRKLELKVERAKRNYNQYQEENQIKTPKSSNLIPINRLSIPGYSENQPLVEYKSESFDDNEDDDVEEISFFPTTKLKNSAKQELSDTFSIQEMTIESDDDSESQILELLPPLSNMKFLDKLINCFYCHSSIRNTDEE